METFDMMSQVIQAAPQVFPQIADIFFKNSDMAGADILAERFEAMLPEQLRPKKDGQPQIPPEIQAQGRAA
jgi:hypothetical protein